MSETAAAVRYATVELPGGTRLHYVERGQPTGVPVVLVHGWPDSWFSWSRVLPGLDPRLHVFAVCQRGFGDSDSPGGGYSIDDHDALFDRGQQDRLVAALPDARFQVFPDTGHSPNWERPEEVAGRLNRFLLEENRPQSG